MTQRGWQQSRGWGWVSGADDEIGALNTIDASSRLAALQSIATGATYDLGVLVDRTSFLASPHVGTEVVAFRTPHGLTVDPGTDLGSPGVSFNTSLVVVSDHAGTQISPAQRGGYAAQPARWSRLIELVVAGSRDQRSSMLAKCQIASARIHAVTKRPTMP